MQAEFTNLMQREFVKTTSLRNLISLFPRDGRKHFVLPGFPTVIMKKLDSFNKKASHFLVQYLCFIKNPNSTLNEATQL